MRRFTLYDGEAYSSEISTDCYACDAELEHPGSNAMGRISSCVARSVASHYVSTKIRAARMTSALTSGGPLRRARAGDCQLKWWFSASDHTAAISVSTIGTVKFRKAPVVVLVVPQHANLWNR